MNRSLQLLLISCLTISLGINGWLLWQKPAQTPQPGSKSNGSYTPDSEYKFLSKRIFATNQNDILINFVELREKLRDYIDWYSDIQIGVYFEYLPSGISIGINDRTNFVSASLLKVPIAMGILKEIETGVIDKGTEGSSDGESVQLAYPTVRFVDAVIYEAVKNRASDIHFEPEEKFVRIRYRVDGSLVQTLTFHKEYWPAISVRVKIISGMNIAESRLPQDGRIGIKIAGKDVDIRVSTVPTQLT